MKKVLIVTWTFAPYSGMGAKRYGLMCKYFKENGYEPYVITAPISTISDGNVRNGLEIPISPEHIIKVNFCKDKCYFTSAILKLFKILKLQSRTIEPTHFWFENAKKAVDLMQLRAIDFDAVIGTYGPMADLYIARYLAKNLNCKYIVDLRDLISDYHEKLPQGYKWASRIDYMIEKMSIHPADGIITANSQFTRDMRKRYPKKKIATICNGWDEGCIEYQDYVADKYLYFAGTVYEFLLDSLVLLFNALKIVNEKENIKMIIRCVGVQSTNVKQIIRKMKMQGIVSCLPPVSENVVKEERSKSYINVVLDSINKKDWEALYSIPGKTYEYMHEKPPCDGSRIRRFKISKSFAIYE